MAKVNPRDSRNPRGKIIVIFNAPRRAWFAGESYCVLISPSPWAGPCHTENACLLMSSVMSQRSRILDPFPITKSLHSLHSPVPLHIANLPGHEWSSHSAPRTPARHSKVMGHHRHHNQYDRATWKRWLQKNTHLQLLNLFSVHLCDTYFQSMHWKHQPKHGKIGFGSIMRVPHVTPYHSTKAIMKSLVLTAENPCLSLQMVHKNLRWFM